MTPDLSGTACEACEHREAGVCAHPRRQHERGPRVLGLWLRFRALIPRGVERPRAPGWCPLRAHEQLALWRGRGAA
jgi:hypothetical protein